MTDDTSGVEERRLRSQLATCLSSGTSREAALSMLRRFYDVAVLAKVFPELSSPPPRDTSSPVPQPKTGPAHMHPVGDAIERLNMTAPGIRREAVAEEDEALTFQFVPLIQCSFPHSDVGGSTFSRKNGRLELTIATSRTELGLPYGTPVRLLTMYITTEVLRTGRREVWLGKSMQEFLNRLGVPITRGDRGSIGIYANQIQRLVYTLFSINETLEDEEGKQGLRIRQSLFCEDAMLWWDQSFVAGEGSVLVIQDRIAEAMLEKSAPLKQAVIHKLKKSPMDLDVYAWLVHRLYAQRRPSLVSWEQLSAQIGHSYAELRLFKFWFERSLKRVLEHYPDAHVSSEPSGLLLKPSRPHILRKSLLIGRTR